jgi:hypothetical protein
MVLFLETCTAEVSSGRPLLPGKASLLRSRKRPARTPPSTFLFLPIHLSNSPGTMAIPLPGALGSRRSPRLPTEIGRLVTLSVRSFAGAPSRRKAGGAPLWAYIGVGFRPCQHRKRQISPQLHAVDGLARTCPVGPATDPARRTGATFLPRCSHRGKASGHGTNQGTLGLSALTRRRWRGIVLVACR